MRFFRSSQAPSSKDGEAAPAATTTATTTAKAAAPAARRKTLSKATTTPGMWVKQQRDNELVLGYEVPEEYLGQPLVLAVALRDQRAILIEAQNTKRAKTAAPTPAGLSPQDMIVVSQARTKALNEFTQVTSSAYEKYQTKFGQPNLTPIEGLIEYLPLNESASGSEEDDEPEEMDSYWTDLRYNAEPDANPALAEEDGLLTLKHVPQNADLEIFLWYGAVDEETGKRHLAPVRSLRLLVTTNKATWAAMLAQHGMSSLVPMFERHNLTHVKDWAEIVDDAEDRKRLNIDDVAAERLSEIIARFGFITASERKRIEHENEELHAFLEETEALMKDDTDAIFYMGQLVETRTRRPTQYVVLSTPDASDETVVVREALGDSGQAGHLIPVADLRPSSWTLFLSHAQAEAQNQVQSLHLLLRNEEVPCWYDMDAEKLEAVDMLRGIRDSKFFLLYLTENYLERFFCRLEATFAKNTNKKVIIIYESDNRHGGGQYTDLIARCTSKFPEFRDWLMATEAIPMARRAFQREAMIHEILKRVGITKQILNRSRGSGSAVEAKLRGQVEDLKEEVNKLWAVVETLQDQLAAQQLN